MADPLGNTWHTFNAYYDMGYSAWYPVNSAVVSYGIGNRNPELIRSGRRRCRQSGLHLDDFGSLRDRCCFVSSTKPDINFYSGNCAVSSRG